MSDSLIDQITMVRNFPSHVGNYDASLPEKECGEDHSHCHCCFRAGWACAVNAINSRLTEMQRDKKVGGR